MKHKKEGRNVIIDVVIIFLIILSITILKFTNKSDVIKQPTVINNSKSMGSNGGTLATSHCYRISTPKKYTIKKDK